MQENKFESSAKWVKCRHDINKDNKTNNTFLCNLNPFSYLSNNVTIIFT